MTKIAYFDCPTGISGDMCLGALVNVGVPLSYLSDALAELPLHDEYQLTMATVQRQGQAATKVHVTLNATAHPPHRHLNTIQTLIQQADLPAQVQAWSCQIFETLAIAEAAVHGTTPDQVHFHEVGATDAIVDIVGTCLGLDWLGIDQIHCSALPTGGGTVAAAHGRLPVPVPAVLKLWESRQVPVYHNGIDRELVTPTGAAIMVTLAASFGQVPDHALQRVGLGAGDRDLPLPNILRLWLGELNGEPLRDQIMVLETQIDDFSPQGLAYTAERLLAAGAWDVFTQGITMKKSRLGSLITVICAPDRALECEHILFTETPTLGIRRRRQERHILERTLETVLTPYGNVRVKVARQQEQVFNIQPEYEDCARLAQSTKTTWSEVHQAAIWAWQNQ